MITGFRDLSMKPQVENTLGLFVFQARFDFYLGGQGAVHGAGSLLNRKQKRIAIRFDLFADSPPDGVGGLGADALSSAD
jgi:hypothetical protein